MGNVDNEMESFGQLLLSSYNTPRVVNTQNTPAAVELHQIRPLIPPVLTPLDLISANIADYRDSKKFSGTKAYRYACTLRARNRNLPLSQISLMASVLWGNHEPADIKQIYIDIAEQAAHMYNFHNGQFPEHVSV